MDTWKVSSVAVAAGLPEDGPMWTFTVVDDKGTIANIVPVDREGDDIANLIAAAPALLAAAKSVLATIGEYCDACGCHQAEESHEENCSMGIDVTDITAAIKQATGP